MIGKFCFILYVKEWMQHFVYREVRNDSVVTNPACFALVFSILSISKHIISNYYRILAVYIHE